MSDTRPVDTGQDALYQQILLIAPQACARWAYPTVDSHLNHVELWPRDRGPLESQHAPHLVTLEVVERGVWRIMLCSRAAVPAGVDLRTRDQMAQAQVAGIATRILSPAAADQIVQAGLFGEVLYR